MSPSLVAEVTEHVEALRRQDREHMEAAAQCGPWPAVYEDLDAFEQAAREVVDLLANAARLTVGGREMLMRAWLSWLEQAAPAEREQKRTQVEEAADLSRRMNALSVDGATAGYVCNLSEAERERLRHAVDRYLRLSRKWYRHVHPRWRGTARVLRRAGASLERVAGPDLAGDLDRALSAISLGRKIVALNGALVPGLRPISDDHSEGARYAAAARATLDIAERMHDAAVRNPWVRPVSRVFGSNDAQAQLAAHVGDIRRALNRLASLRNLFKGLDALRPFLKEGCLAEPRNDALEGRSIGTWLDLVADGVHGLESLEWLDAERSMATGLLAQILKALEQYEQQRLSGKSVPVPSEGAASDCGRWWWALVRFAAIDVWKERMVRENPILNEMNPVLESDVCERRRVELAERMKKKRDLNIAHIHDLWRGRRLNRRQQPWKRILQLRRSKHGEAKRLREALRLGLDMGLLDLKPCWLVNPSVACEVLPLKPSLFDVVIFDEASQCPVEHAIPVIYRGRRLVVTGDERQLPPTSFFIPKSEVAEQEEESDADATDEPVQKRVVPPGVQAVLSSDELLTATVELDALPEERLLVHYRSEHPDLIRFSNEAFYAGKLEIPPARHPLCKDGLGPILYEAVNGVYENRTNMEEARRVVQSLRSIWLEDPHAPTVGVVTFNLEQRDLIEDLIERECARDAAFARKFEEQSQRRDGNLDVGFFVKNLESVQGDERDVIIFSMTFGREPDGQFFRRFGPVGAEGGERRLNVAVTRAKRRVYVLNSMPVNEISQALSAGQALGAGLTPKCYLQLYLAYAEAVSQSDEEAIQRVIRILARSPAALGNGEPESEFERDVGEEIMRMGFQVHYQVGVSGFRIDIGVRHPEHACGYLLGIECDGAAFHTGWEAHHRDVWRQRVLEQRGWRIHRVWSTRWWRDRDAEREKLMRALDAARKHRDEQ